MPISLEQNVALRRSLAPFPWARVPTTQLLPRRRPGSRPPQSLVRASPFVDGLGEGEVPPSPVPSPEGGVGGQVASIGQSFPVLFQFRCQGNSVNLGVLGPFPGPLIIDEISVEGTISGGTATDLYHLYRVDFSENAILPALVFNAGGIPTGSITDDVTLWPFVNWVDGVDAVAGVQKGWVHWHSVNSALIALRHVIGRYVPYPAVYIKAFYQNEAAGAAIFGLKITVRSLSYQSIYLGGAVGLDVVGPETYVLEDTVSGSFAVTPRVVRRV